MVSERITLNSVVVLSKDQVSCDLAGEAAILNLKAGKYYGLDEVGARAWSLLRVPRPIHEIKKTLLDEYEVKPEQCERDLLALFLKLENEGLVEIKSESTA